MSRTRSLVLGAAPLLAACAAAPRVDLAAERAAVEARSQAVAAAEHALNADVVEFYATDAVFQPAGAPQMQGREALAAMYSQNFEAIRNGTIKEFSSNSTSIEVAASGDLAYEAGVNRLVLKDPNGDLVDTGKYLVVWKKIEGTWYVAAVSASSDAPAPVPLKPEGNR